MDQLLLELRLDTMNKLFKYFYLSHNSYRSVHYRTALKKKVKPHHFYSKETLFLLISINTRLFRVVSFYSHRCVVYFCSVEFCLIYIIIYRDL